MKNKETSTFLWEASREEQWNMDFALNVSNTRKEVVEACIL